LSSNITVDVDKNESNNSPNIESHNSVNDSSKVVNYVQNLPAPSSTAQSNSNNSNNNIIETNLSNANQQKTSELMEGV